MYLFPSLYFKLFSSGFLKGSVQLDLAFLFILIIFHFNRGTSNIIICLDLNLSSCYLFSISSILSLFHFTYFGLIDCFIAFYESILFLLFGQQIQPLCYFIGCLSSHTAPLSFATVCLQVMLHYFIYDLRTSQKCTFVSPYSLVLLDTSSQKSDKILSFFL